MTLELSADSPGDTVPWIITFGPLSDEEEWDAVVCGPYERPHALAIAEEIVGDEDMMAVVEPLLPHVDVDAIREEIATAKAQALEALEEEEEPGDVDIEVEDLGSGGATEGTREGSGFGGPPRPDEIRAGFSRIAARLTDTRLA